MTKSAKSQTKNKTKTGGVSQTDIYRGQKFYELVGKLQEVEEHINELEDSSVEIDRRYQDVFNGKIYKMYNTNKELITLFGQKMRLLQRINEILELEMGEQDGNQ